MSSSGRGAGRGEVNRRRPGRRVLPAALILLLTVSASSLLPGCGLKLGEKAPGSTPPRLSGQGYSCVGKVPEYLERYFADQMDGGQITEFARCMQKSFLAFGQLTRGRDSDVYSPGEIRAFLHSSFLRERKISDAYMEQLMLVKQLLIGGSNKTITRQELGSLIQFFDEIGREAIRLKPHLKVLNPRLADQQDPHELGERLEAANEALGHLIQVITARLHACPTKYRFTDLAVLIQEFRSFAHWQEHFKNVKPVEAWVRMLRLFKQTAVSPLDGEAIKPNEWGLLLKSMASWYLAYLEYRVGVKPKMGEEIGHPRPRFFEGVRLRNVIYLERHAYNLMKEAVERQGIITFEQIYEIVEAMQDLDWFNRSIQIDSLRKALPSVIPRVFGDHPMALAKRKLPSTGPGLPQQTQVALSPVHEEGVKPENLAAMHGTFEHWAFVQQILERQYHGSFTESANIFPWYPVLYNQRIQSEIENAKDSDWEDFEEGIKQTGLRPLFPEPRGTLVYLLPDRTKFERYRLTNGFNNLSMMNLFRTVVTLVVRGYSKESDRDGWSSGIELKEMQLDFYQDIRALGVNLGILDPRSTGAGARTFTEGTLFTYTAKGIDFLREGDHSKLGISQGMEVASILYSGGQVSTQLYHELARVCPTGPVDYSCLPTIKRACVREHLPEIMEKTLVNLPGIQYFLRHASEGVRHDYATSYLQTARNPNNDTSQFSAEEWVEKSELSTISVLLHYSEIVMTRFDRNRDGILNWAELKEAIPVFSGYIAKYSSDKNERNLKASWVDKAVRDLKMPWYFGRGPEGVFLFILENKRIPDRLSDVVGGIIPRGVGDDAVNGGLYLDRMDLASVFKVIIGNILRDSPAIKTAIATCQNPPQ